MKMNLNRYVLQFFNKPMLIRHDYFENFKNMCFIDDDGEDSPFKINSFLRVKENVAVLRIHGVIVEKQPYFSMFVGCDTLMKDLKKVEQSEIIDTLVLDIDSPGGEVDGVCNVADFIYELGKKIKTVAIVNSMAASAGYWFAAACNKIGLVSETASVGSIGVAYAHVDISKALENEGICVTHIVAGKFKRATAREIPLTEEGARILQDNVEHIYSIFVGRIAKYKDSTPGEVESFADGRMFIGQLSIPLLSDGIIDLKKLMGVSEMPDIFADLFKLEDDKPKKDMTDENEEEEAEEEDEEHEAEDDSEEEEAEDDSEEEEAEDDSEEEEAEEHEDKKKAHAKITRKTLPYAKTGVRLERKRVVALVKLGLSGGDLIKAIKSGQDEKTVAYNLMVAGKSPKKSKKRRKPKASTVNEGAIVATSTLLAPTKKEKAELDADLEAAKSGAEHYNSRNRR